MSDTIDPNNVLTLEDLSIHFPTPGKVVHAVSHLSLQIPRGKRVGFIGESGSGKTTAALSVMRMLAQPGFVAGGSIHLADTDILALSETEMRSARLSRVSYIPQGAMNSLNPVMRVEDQIWDGITAHEGMRPAEELQQRALEVLKSVGLPERTAKLFPHELSGGMKQRVCIAIGIALKPDLIIADEPTSALDVITQRQVMQTLKQAQEGIGSALLMIGHDMGLMAQSVDYLAVLKLGELVEFGTVRQIIEAPEHAYTKELISSVPLVGGESFLAAEAKSAPPDRKLADAPLLEFKSAAKVYGDTTAVHPLSLTLDGKTPRIISVVGQSGSGKSTLGGMMLGFTEPTRGEVLFEGRKLSRLNSQEKLDFRRDVQAVFQDPYGCFNPFYRVEHALKFPFKRFGLAESEEHTRTAMYEACRAVGLDPDLVLRRYPHQLSGGQRQRLIVARALMLSPKLLIADEPVSMVDASLRATILKNIYDLKDEHGISIIYITHDLATAYHVSDYVIVLYHGRVAEAGPPKEVIGDPQHPYTRLLIDSIPWPDVDRDWGTAEAAQAGLERMAGSKEFETAVIRGTLPGFALDTK